MTIKEMRTRLGDTQTEFSKRYNIPFRTVQNWESGTNVPPPYLVEMLSQRVNADLVNRKQFEIPHWRPNAKKLPAGDDYSAPLEWLITVSEALGGNVVFALDSALMCDGSYLGRMGESLIWAYGPDSLSDYAGVCVIGNRIDENDLEERHGIRYTNFNRTLNDSLANERILDMQGITEALGRYYTAHNDSFEGLHPDPEYLDVYNRLKSDAADYYTY